jgi:hypothetical protein
MSSVVVETELGFLQYKLKGAVLLIGQSARYRQHAEQ